MGSSTNVNTVKRMINEFWSKGDDSVVPEVYDESYKRNDAHAPGVVGHEAIRAVCGMFRTGFPDLTFKINDNTILSEGDKVALHYRCTGTNEGEFMGTPATGNKIDITGTAVFKMKDGKILEDWHDYDMLTFSKQLGGQA